MMRTPLARLELLEPRTVREALAMLESERDLTPFAGGTDLYVTLNAGTEKARRFIDLSRLAPLRRIALDSAPAHRRLRERRRTTSATGAPRSRLGAVVCRSPSRRSRAWCAGCRCCAPPLAKSAVCRCRIVGRSAATSATHHRPATRCPCWPWRKRSSCSRRGVVNAACRSTSSSRVIAARYAAINSSGRRTVRRPDELIAAFEIPRVKGKQWFRKVGTRAAQAISKVVAAGVEHEGKVRFALGAVAPVVVRARKAEGILNEGGEVKAASAALVSEITPIDDVRSTRVYRQRVAANLLEAFCAEIRRD
jgi:xanthine dehydrogenase small subunit